MLACSLLPNPGPLPWTWDGDRLTDGRSWVLPYSGYETQVVTDGQRTLIVVRDRVPALPAAAARPRVVSPDRYEEHVDCALIWPAAWCVLEVEPDLAGITPGPHEVHRPLWTATSGGALIAAWDFAELLELAGGLCPQPRPLAARTTAMWDGSELTAIAHPGPAVFPRARATAG